VPSFVVHTTITILPKEGDMQYAVLIYNKPGAHEALGEQEYEAVEHEYFALTSDPLFVGGVQLQSIGTATTVREQAGETTTTDGPFADTKEILGGFYTLEAENLDQVLEFASRVPTVRLGGSVEVRPLVER
jgi:hypothetical protein